MKFNTMPSPTPEHMTVPPPSKFERANTEMPPSSLGEAPTEIPPVNTDLEELRTGAAQEDAEVIAKYEQMLANVRSADAPISGVYEKLQEDVKKLSERMEDEDGPETQKFIRFNPDTGKTG